MAKALVGLFGPTRFQLAVSADGSTFLDGLSVDNATGIVDQHRFKAFTNYDNYVGVDTRTKIGLNNTDYNDPAGHPQKPTAFAPGMIHFPELIGRGGDAAGGLLWAFGPS